MIVIIQGPIDTEESLNNLELNIRAFCRLKCVKKIIVSCYKNEFTERIDHKNRLERIYIKYNDDPGTKIIEPIRRVPFNLDRQMRTSSIPDWLDIQANEPILKIRSDLKVTGIGLFFIKNIIKKWEKFESKIFVLPVTTTNPSDLNYPALQVCDWFYLMRHSIYKKVFDAERDKKYSYENEISNESGRLNFGVENFITNRILDAIGIKKYDDMWDLDRDKWNAEFNDNFEILPYILCFKSIKYKRVYKNLLASPKMKTLKTTMKVIGL